MFWYSSVIFVLLVQHISAQETPYGSSDFLRFGCSQLVIERTDPLVTPGLNPSPHMHQIVGGNSFNVTVWILLPLIQPRNRPALRAFTSWQGHSRILTAHLYGYREYRSNYWTASIYFKSPENGTCRKVPQMANGCRNGTLLEQDGGLTIYYMRPFSGTNKNTTAMLPGFRMLAGDPTNRSKEGIYPGTCHRCLQVDERVMGGAGAPCSGNDTANFSSTPCPGGILATVIFPSCWDGVTLDSPDHRSHVAYAPGFGGLAGDFCPSSHQVRIPQVMYEVMLNTSGFADPKYYQDGKQPLVYSFGDGTGYVAYGDYLFGWEGDALQRGMNALGNQCGSENCTSTFTIQDGRDAIACMKAQQAVEDIGADAWLDELPGGVQVTG